MLTKAKLLSYIKIFLGLLMAHFVLITFVKFKLGADLGIALLNKNIRSLWKEGAMALLCTGILYLNYKSFGLDIKKYFVNRYHALISALIVIFGLLGLAISLINHLGIGQISLGVKYDLIMLMPIIFWPMLRLNSDDFKFFLDSLIRLIKYVIYFSLGFWLIRLFKPSLLGVLGYGAGTEYIPGNKPPYFYGTIDTKFYSTKRESGIFSGPNVLGFWTAFVLPILLSMYIYVRNKLRQFSGWLIIFALFLLLVSLSRSALIAFFVEIILIGVYIMFVHKTQVSKRLKTLVWSISIFFGLFVIVGLIHGFLYRMIERQASTGGHIQNIKLGIQTYLAHPLGLGLGTAGPAALQTGLGIVPENWYLQIFIETGTLGGLIYLAIWAMILVWARQTSNTFAHKDYMYKTSKFLIIGVIGILSTGMFLHMFDDAMIAYFVSGILGLYLSIQNNEINYKK